MTPGFFLFLESKLVSLVFGVMAQSLAESKLGDDPRFRLDFAAFSDSVIECKDQKSEVFHLHVSWLQLQSVCM